ncbi:T9SS type A sorting domain-containing protein [Paucihalobacter ruber]|uniref:T9SS type A sorting domain-containing protein n=1 Tax=Paucihalobacter ruber TaxID=2567861 RepID=A0A506PPZ2_9FLAO|nr:T9SS type A sorting domain-containing protein [Paucihalobacter ruber]TPV35933.1 T9SS type A sorting domain-containing protein [Paucihalobacter ruber]
MRTNFTLFFTFIFMAFTHAQVTYTVNTTDDTEDADLSDTICADSNGNCSFRAAIQNANKTSNKDIIAFDISGTAPFQIQVVSDVLPPIQQPAVVDGRTQTGYTNAPLIEIDGTLLGAGYQGIQFTGNAHGSEMYGMSIGGFQEQDVSPFNFGFGVLVNFVDNITFQGNYIGLRSDGTTLFTNTGGGILFNNSSNSLVGGINPNEGNIISGNFSGGLTFQNGTNNLVQGNFIGTDITATLNRGNRFNVQLINSSNNTIGGAVPEARNIISGGKNDQNETFDGTGFSIVGASATGNRILGNYIGTDITGTQSIPNLRGGVLLLFGANNNEIGGINPGDGNLISGNGFYGVYFQGNEDSPVTENFIQGNKIGVDVTGNLALSNQIGVALFSGVNNNNFIGGLVPGARNIISGNSNTGVAILAGNNNQIFGNYIGTNSNGNTAVANPTGVAILDVNNTVGGTIAGSRNIISGNNVGISLEENCTGTIIQGNFIGTDASGSSAVPNQSSGINIASNAQAVTIGGEESGRNIISGNQVGLTVRRTGHNISYNYVGLNPAGTSALPNQIGVQAFGLLEGTQIHHNVISGNGLSAGSARNLLLNGATQLQAYSNIIGLQSNGFDLPGGINAPGIVLQNSSNNIIGGATADLGNVISGNGNDGILLIFSSNGNQILNNLIGLAIDGETVVGNGTGVSSGIVLSGNITSAFISKNVLSGSGNGVFLDPALGAATGVTISENSIYGNSGEGIRLAGANANDPGDADTGPNNLQNYPEIISIDFSGGNQVEISYEVPSDPANSAYPITVEFFGADNGQGKTYLGTDTYTTTGPKSFLVTFPDGFGQDDYEFIVGTATDDNGNTSEFSLQASLSNQDFLAGNFTLYPNPAKDWFKINLNSNSQYDIELISISGQLIKQFKNVTRELQVAVDNMPQGLYLVKIHDNLNNQSIQRKLIVQ